MVSMFPSVSRVKLNRAMLNDVGLNLVPRRRRLLKSLNNLESDSKTQTNNLVCEPVSQKDAASVPGSNEPVQTFLTRHMDSESVTGVARSLCEGEPSSCRRTPMDVRQDEGNAREIDRNRHPSPTGRSCPEQCLRRAGGAPHCDLCVKCQYIFPPHKITCMHRPKFTRPDSETSKVDLKIKKGNAVPKASKKIVIWLDQYPKVTLCDLSQKCHACSHNCGYELPNVLKRKVVRCFKRDMRAGFHLWPICLGYDKHKSEKNRLVKSSKGHPIVGCEKRISLSQSLIEHQKHQEEGKDTNEGECRTGMGDRNAVEDHGLGSQTHRDKKIKLQTSEGSSSTFASAVKENCITEEPCGHDPTKTQMSQYQDIEEDTAESFTCQRVRVYMKEVETSCARTCMSWPFSNSNMTCTAATPCLAGSVNPSTRDKRDSETVSQNLPSSCSKQIKDTLSKTPTENQKENGTSMLAERNGKRLSNMSSFSDMEIAPCHMQSLASLHSDTASFSSLAPLHREPVIDTVSASSLLVNGAETHSSMSTPSPSALGLSDLETDTTLSSPMFIHSGLSSLSETPSPFPPSTLLKKVPCIELKAVENTLLNCKGSQMDSCSPSPYAPVHNSDCSQSCDSSLLLPQDDSRSDEELLTNRSPPKLEPYYNISPFKHSNVVACLKENLLLCNISKELCMETGEFTLPPVLSPVASPPRQPWRRNFSLQSSGCSGEEMEEEESSIFKLKEVSTYFEALHDSTEGEPSSSGTDEEVDESNEEESHDETDCEHNAEDANRHSEQVPLDPKLKATLTSGVLTETCSSPSSDEDDSVTFSNEGPWYSGGERSSPQITSSGRAVAGDCQPGSLDEVTAYEQDILLVNVIQDDPELFTDLPDQRLLKLGPTRVIEAPKIQPSSNLDGATLGFKQGLTAVNITFHCNSPENTEERNSRPWRPQWNTTTTSKTQNTGEQTRNLGNFDVNNNNLNDGLEWSPPTKTANPPHDMISLLRPKGNGPWITNSANTTDFRRQKSDPYCRHYFSESLSCGFKMCRFQHLPLQGDEKFCAEIVTRFTKNPACLQKAGAVFTGYYQKNPPGVYFSMPALLSLLWALLKAGMVCDVFSVLSVSLAHKIVPGHEFLLALYNFVREKGFTSLVPELIQLTFKMANAGLELSLDCLDCVKNAPVFQQKVCPDSPGSLSSNHKSSTGAPMPECLDLALAVVEIELCTTQEDWRRMGDVLRSICHSGQHPNQVERLSGRIAIALLSESKDKLSLPFAAFAKTVYQKEGEDSLIIGFVGRIGVSLMLRYHKTHQWVKGRKVVEIMSLSKINYSTLKGLFGNENGASRCCLVTVATELFLRSGSVQGALHTLRENEWFLSSLSWPCEPADLESRTGLLIRLSEKTSHRETLEVLCNLPGIKEPNGTIDISRYSHLFNTHLQACVDRQILPVASDTIIFMLSKKLPVDHKVLKMLFHKLGQQSLWLRAREVFRCCLSGGYYPGVFATPGCRTLLLPCQLGEVELALTFEMFIAVNATVILQLSETTTSSLSITLKRTLSCERAYLSAGSRLLSAACILQPKVTVHYVAVNSLQEQVFSLDVPSARRWLRCNHLWANEVWTH
ncbi:protein TOPAZ1 isoform X3 [Mugil cephalus]|uniref:protein TOPAZ1 isoform X3 n=1 Tax=Mugil cephalus TaxID=48193 RepID=UPI001FB72BA9|nr:protein TOPAZ1 isoform X3 [Mugil cephalus]